jgi:Flp pilus assembly protein TadG
MPGCNRLQPARSRKAGIFSSRHRRGTAALEFAILSVPFFLLILGVCELSFDLFLQEATDLALQEGARQMEIGAGTGATGESNFVKNYVCNTPPGKMLVCSNFHIKVQDLTSTQDYSSPSVSTGTLPMTGNTLNLASYEGTNGVSVFCTAPPGTLIMISAIYIGPSFLSGLLPGMFSEVYNGKNVHAVLSQVGVASEEFPVSTNAGAAPQC